MKGIMYFYKYDSPYGNFSNFAPYPINLKGKIWPSNEHYFQAQKFEDPFYQKEILKAKDPMKAAELGRNSNVMIRKNWDSIKENVMYEALYAKFTQHPELRILLESTGDAKLVEHTSKDSYWGDGGDGSGKNKLGILLMKIREELCS